MPRQRFSRLRDVSHPRFPPHFGVQPFFFAEASLASPSLRDLYPKKLGASRAPSERPAHGETERRPGLKIIQAPRVVQQLLQGSLYAGPLARGQSSRVKAQGRTTRTGHQRLLVRRLANLDWVNIWILRHQLVVQPIDVVRVVDTKRCLNDGKLDDKLDAR